MPTEKLPVKSAKMAGKPSEKPVQKAKKRLFKKRERVPVPRYNNGFSYEDLMNLEAQWGGMLFGPIPAGHQRKFFAHKKNVWVWYEGWLDKAGVPQEMTVRYEVRPAGVFKRVDGQKYEKLAGDELDNFRAAAKNYLSLMKSKLYY